MFKATLAIFAVVACVAAKPGFVAPLAYSAPLVSPGVVTATSSQVFSRNYNGLVAAPLVAAHAPLAYTGPVAAKYVSALRAAPLAYSAPLTYSSPLAYTAPLASLSSPYVRYAHAAPVFL